MTYLYEALAKHTRLYIKQCPHCGLKYFGKTVKKNITTYKGSGVKWKAHLKKHKVFPVHLWHSDWYTDTSITRFALRFSRINKIVKSDLWANLTEESGIDNASGTSLPEDRKMQLSKSMMGVCRNDFDEATRRRMSEAARNREIQNLINGKSRFAGEVGSKFATERNKKLVEEKRHNFLGKGQEVSLRQKKKVEDGTFHLLGKLLCVDKLGNVVYIDSKTYHSQSGKKEDRDYVHVSSKEAKIRKLTAMKGTQND